MIRIAIPNKGRLHEPSISIFNDAGLPINGTSRKLFAKTTDPEISILFARAADIPEYVQDGAADVGITGIDLVTECDAEVKTLLDLKFGKAKLVLAVPNESVLETPADLQGKKVATEFPKITARYFEEKGIKVEVIKVSGACEMTPHVGIADAIVDISSSGTTLMLNRLRVIEQVFSSSVYLIANKESYKTKEKIQDIKTAFESVLNAKERRYLMMNVPETALKAVKEVLPGMSGPTIMKVESSKAGEPIVAVHAVVDAALIFTLVNNLKKVGARDILVIPIERIMP
ncbi:MAG: ATP phosphoribosyltransferase [Methanosarcinaceae archaeon]|nr:ATP phosphoribosyltransferase [Methanosarcinaceae archaeon]MDD4330912.1 ATP phosphoribosyltransferase [Methanosarcinaceae archaeon]MDD4749662.1 ATP phosphoribosyltransferase [Methanosarcinaceae archaeon]